jgi:hypothetical protein
MRASHQAGFDLLNGFSGVFFVARGPFYPGPENPLFSERFLFLPDKLLLYKW